MSADTPWAGGYNCMPVSHSIFTETIINWFSAFFNSFYMTIVQFSVSLLVGWLYLLQYGKRDTLVCLVVFGCGISISTKNVRIISTLSGLAELHNLLCSEVSINSSHNPHNAVLADP